jgi:hypothetical protein
LAKCCGGSEKAEHKYCRLHQIGLPLHESAGPQAPKH